jgi:hypothetical protein
MDGVQEHARAPGRPWRRGFRWLRAQLWHGTEWEGRGDRSGGLTSGGGRRRRQESAGGGSSAMEAGSNGTDTEKAMGIRWERPQNCRLNGKTERNQRDERDGVLTFGQRWTTAMEELAGVGEELAGLGEDDGGDVGFAWPSTSRHRARRGKLQGGVHMHRKCTGLPEKLAGSSPEFSRCKI